MKDIMFSREDIQFAGYATPYSFNNISIDKVNNNSGMKYREYNLLPKKSLIDKCSEIQPGIKEINLCLYEDESIGINFGKHTADLLYNSHISIDVNKSMNYMTLRAAVENELSRSRSSIYQELQSLSAHKFDNHQHETYIEDEMDDHEI